jgi:hypothetical protein
MRQPATPPRSADSSCPRRDAGTPTEEAWIPPLARVNVLTGRTPAVGSHSDGWVRPIVRPHERGNDWPMNSKRSRGDNALTLSTVLLAGAAAAWAAWVWYGRWRDAETAFEHRAVTR